MPQPNSILVPCPVCHALFQTWPGVIRKGGGKFCSQKCYWTTVKPQRATLIPCACRHCGREFQVRESAVNRGGGQFCSRTCGAIGRGRDWIPSDQERLWATIRRTEAGCMVRAESGYTRITTDDGRVLYAHEFAWEIANGCRVSEGLEILHSCDNPPCINPDHLSADTHLANMLDAANKGRMAHGERSGAHLLTDLQVLEIRRLRQEAGMKYRDLSARFGVSVTAIAHIVCRRTWRHLP